MKKKNLSDGKKFLVILLFSISIVFFGIFLAFFIKFLYMGIINNNRDNIDESFISLGISFIIGLIFFISQMILLKTYDRTKKEKNKKWYIDKILLSFIPVFITFTVVLFSFYADEYDKFYLYSTIILFLIIGIISTPNVILYALNDMKNWKNIFHENGNLSKTKTKPGFYMMKSPVSFEKKIYFAVLKDQILNINAVIIYIALFLIFGLFINAFDAVSRSGDIFYAIMHTRSVRAEGYFFFGGVFLSSFWIPIFAYYITNAVYKLRVVRHHEYIAYHAIVDRVDTFKLKINNSGFNYSYNYCSCVGIKSKKVNKTNSILIFIPDDLLLFPDNEKYRK